MNQLSDDDKDLLRWSGELEGQSPPELQAELDHLSTAVKRLPQQLAPTTTLSEAIDRHEHTRRSRWSGLRLTLCAVAAAVVVFSGVSLLLQNETPAPPSSAPVAETDPDNEPELTAPVALPAQFFPKTESKSLQRIRDVRARINRIKNRKKSRSFRKESENHDDHFHSISI